MRYFSRIISVRVNLILSCIILILLIIANFYGLYSNRFHVFKPANYIFPLLTVIHFVYLYVLQFKVKVDEGPDPSMRNLEYVLYAVFLVYFFKIYETVNILLTFNDFQTHIIPSTFLPIGIVIISLYVALILNTLLAFKQRKEIVGDYVFDNMNEKIDSW